MMYLESTDILDQPADVVYPLIRDEMEKIVPYLPNVERIVQVKYERQEPTRVEIINHWFVKAEIPAVAQKMVRPELFSWKDYAFWKDDEYCVDYHLESFLANDLYDARGTNYFRPYGQDQTEIKITCNVEIYPERVPGIPTFLLKKMMPTIENIISRLLGPNLTSLGQGLTAYFAAQQK